MPSFNALLRARPCASRVPVAVVQELLEVAGFQYPLSPRALRFFADETGVDVEALMTEVDVGWSVLSALACVLNLHPLYVRRTAHDTVGPWFITPTAIQQRMDISAGTLDYDEARSELAALAQHLINNSAVPRTSADGRSMYRGPRPLRLSVIVAPPGSEHVFPAIIGVAGNHDRVHVTLPRDKLEGFDEKDAAAFAGALLKQRYGQNSVGVADDAAVFGVPPRMLDELLRSYKIEKRQQLDEASNYLKDALVKWGHQHAECEANDARAGAQRLLQLLKRNAAAFPKLWLREEAALRRLAEAKDTAEAERALVDEHASLMDVATRYQNRANQDDEGMKSRNPRDGKL